MLRQVRPRRIPVELSLLRREFRIGREHLACPKPLLPYFTQLFLNERSQRGPLTDPQLLHCAVMGCLQVSSLGTLLQRFNKAFEEAFGMPLLRRERGKGYLLSHKIVLVLDVAPDEARQFIFPHEEQHSVAGLSILHSVQRLFEQGEYPPAADKLATIWTLPLHPVQTVEAKCWECWIELRRSGDGNAVRQKTSQLAHWFTAFEKTHALPDIVRARVYIQLARTASAYQQEDEARHRFVRARRLLPDDAWRELSSIQAGLGYIATRSGDLLEGEMYFRLALHHAALAHWPWSVQIQLGNLADVLYEQYQQLKLPPGPHSLLTEAAGLLEQSQQICDGYGFRGSADTELYRARCAIAAGDLELAGALIRQALAVVEAAQAEYDYALTWTVKSEWEVARGDLQKGVESLSRAVRLESELGTEKDAEKLRLRLQKLESQLGCRNNEH